MWRERYAKKIEDMRNRYAFVISRQIASVSYFFLANDRDQCAMTTIFYFQRANKFCYRKSYRNLLDSVIKSKSNLEK